MFIRSFTKPKYEKGELWKISNTPLIVIHLNFVKKDKDDKKKNKKNAKKKEEAPAADVEDEDSNSINYFPKLDKCLSFF